MVNDAARDSLIQQRVVRNTLSNLVGKFITLGLGFLLTPFILNRLGAVQYGLWALIGSFVAYGSILDLGIAGAVVKYVAEHRAKEENEQAHYLVATALSLYTLLGLVGVALSVILAPFLTNILKVPVEEHTTAFFLFLISGITVGVSVPCTLTVAILRGLQRFDYVNIVSTLGTLISLVAMISVLLLGGGVIGMVASNIPVILLMQWISILLIHRAAPELKVGWRGARISLVKKILSYSASLFVMDIAGRLQNQTDEIVISAFLPIILVTPYSLARRLSELPHILTDQFMKVLLPLASELDAGNDRSRLQLLYLLSTKLTMVSFMPIAIPLIILSPSILTVWVGQEYARYAPLIVILTVASLVVTSQWPAGAILQGMGKQKFLAYTSAGSGIVNLILSIVFIRPFGIMGVALGTLVPTAIECIFFVFPYTMNVMNISLVTIIKKSFLPAIIPTIPMAAFIFLLTRVTIVSTWFSLILIPGIGLILYLLIYFKWGAGNIERTILKDIVHAIVRFINALLKPVRPEIR